MPSIVPMRLQTSSKPPVRMTCQQKSIIFWRLWETEFVPGRLKNCQSSNKAIGRTAAVMEIKVSLMQLPKPPLRVSLRDFRFREFSTLAFLRAASSQV